MKPKQGLEIQKEVNQILMGQRFRIPESNWQIRADKYVYHGTDFNALLKIQKDGFLKPNFVTHNENYGISNNRTIYFTDSVKHALQWIQCIQEVIIRVEKTKLTGKIELDDISEGFGLITWKQGDLEFSLDKGKTWHDIKAKVRQITPDFGFLDDIAHEFYEAFESTFKGSNKGQWWNSRFKADDSEDIDWKYPPNEFFSTSQKLDRLKKLETLYIVED